MSITYHLLDPKGELLSSADTIEYLRGLVAELPPGSYAVDEIRVDPPPSGQTGKRWGTIRRFEDGTILLEPDPWES